MQGLTARFIIYMTPPCENMHGTHSAEHRVSTDPLHALLPLWPAAQLQHWFKDHFFKAFEWALSHPSAVETTKVRKSSRTHVILRALQKRLTISLDIFTK